MAGFGNTTLVFLVKKSSGKINELCLAYKKRGFGANRWNGVGGKLINLTETIQRAAIRETKEEISVVVDILHKVAELNFTFPHHPTWNQLMNVFLADTWQGEPTESEEMKPQWFKVADIPYANMWPDDAFWLPEVLKGNLVKGEFEFANGDVISKQKVRTVDGFD